MLVSRGGVRAELKRQKEETQRVHDTQVMLAPFAVAPRIPGDAPLSVSSLEVKTLTAALISAFESLTGGQGQDTWIWRYLHWPTLPWLPRQGLAGVCQRPQVSVSSFTIHSRRPHAYLLRALMGRYEGQFIRGIPHGNGRMRYQNNDVYEGNWLHGFVCGAGDFTLGADRTVFSGEFGLRLQAIDA